MLKYRGKEIKDITELGCNEYLLLSGGRTEIVGVVKHKLYDYAYIGKIGDNFEYDERNLDGELFDIDIRVIDNIEDDNSELSSFTEIYNTELDMLEREVIKEEKHQRELSKLIDMISEHVGEKYNKNE